MLKMVLDLTMGHCTDAPPELPLPPKESKMYVLK
jgi:hypothetical protein